MIRFSAFLVAVAVGLLVAGVRDQQADACLRGHRGERRGPPVPGHRRHHQAPRAVRPARLGSAPACRDPAGRAPTRPRPAAARPRPPWPSRAAAQPPRSSPPKPSPPSPPSRPARPAHRGRRRPAPAGRRPAGSRRSSRVAPPSGSPSSSRRGCCRLRPVGLEPRPPAALMPAQPQAPAPPPWPWSPDARHRRCAETPRRPGAPGPRRTIPPAPAAGRQPRRAAGPAGPPRAAATDRRPADAEPPTPAVISACRRSATRELPGRRGQRSPPARGPVCRADEQPTLQHAAVKLDDEPAAVLQREVTVVPGVPRYHTPQCLLIRFMGDGDLNRMTVSAARAAGCSPCRACLPDQPDPDAPAELYPPEPEGQAEAGLDVLPRRLGLRSRTRRARPGCAGP